MKQRYQNARKYFVAMFDMDENSPFVDVAKKVVEESNGKILFDSEEKIMCGMFLDAVLFKVKLKNDYNPWSINGAR